MATPSTPMPSPHGEAAPKSNRRSLGILFASLVIVIMGGLAVGILGFASMALASTLWLFGAAALLFAGGNVLLQPSVTSLISKRARDGQGVAMGLNNFFQALGRGLGPLWAGVAFDMSSTLSFWTGALIQAVALFYASRHLHAFALAPGVETAAPATGAPERPRRV